MALLLVTAAAELDGAKAEEITGLLLVRAEETVTSAELELVAAEKLAAAEELVAVEELAVSDGQRESLQLS